MISISFKKKKLIEIINYCKFLFIFLFIFDINIFCYANNLNKKNNCINQVIFFGLNKKTLQNNEIYKYIKKNCLSTKKIFNILQVMYLHNMINNLNIIQYKNFIFIKILEKPIINNIKIEGNKIIGDHYIHYLLDKLDIKKNNILNNNSLFLFKKNIKLIFLKNSMFFSYIKIKIKRHLNNKVDIKILFKKYNSIDIDDINIIGNKAYKTNFLLKNLNINNKFLFFFINKRKYRISDINYFIYKLNNFYINQGYLKFEIQDVIQNISRNKTKKTLTIKIKENKPFFYKRILIILNTNKYFKKSIQNIINIIPGETYNTNTIIKLKYKIIKFFKKNGFVNPKVIIRPIIDKKKNTVDILIYIKNNHQYYIRKINFLGNNYTKDSLLRNELLQSEGDLLNLKLIKKTKERLLSLGYFNKVEIFLYKNYDLKNTLNIIFKVDEKNEGFLKTGIGIIKGGSLGLNTVLQQNNFIGTGYDVDIDFHKDFYHYYFEIFIMKNHAFFRKINSGIKIFLNSINEDDNFFYNYLNKNKGFLGIFKLPINNKFFIENNIGFIKNKITNIEPQLSLWNYLRNIGYQKYNKLYKYYLLDEFIIHCTFIFKNLNDFNLPSSGILSSLDTYFSIPWYSKNRYFKINFNYLQYFPIFCLQKLKNNFQNNNFIVFLFKSNFSYGNGFLGGKYPFYKNFYLGGSNSIRGFQINSIGPKGIYYSSKEYNCSNKKTICLSNIPIGGNILFSINNELIIPLFFLNNRFIKQIRSSIFLDIGNVIDTSLKNNYLLKLYKIPKFNLIYQIRSSIGLSFQFRTSFGNIIISFAYPFKKYKMDKIQFFQFNFVQKWV
ncbi:outer membrane protein assembly factor BamA [Enterobacteriaceae endosymbiont of Donacia cincticornis]|uniref:outer membrane protein assembly factor BamA n=1 Tax=Enterobacteriaceae endosymbiont of Donacia cincticornis TaxID=2675773 RepID=UPI001449420A|nr:outer membrane protein assembly factor BamA [Enterobacteriaceae endosymbiont of Donacia cincticornis]QJC36108.1 outer membrane protein assembly factor BamA [Enterobacteriaceae endosymbiont of Donacia cincticornis]